MRYDIPSHPLLTEEAQALGAESLEAHGRVAEQLLGLLLFPAFEAGSDNFKAAQDAVALQVSYQVNSGMDAFILSHFTRGGRTKSFRGGRRMPILHGLAKKIVQRIKPKVVVAPQ